MSSSQGRHGMPTGVRRAPNWFDQFAAAANSVVSRGPFFAFCVLIVVIWLPTLTFLTVDTSQLIVNTVTSIITFLLVALLQNAQTRSDDAVQRKLNAIADGLADLMTEVARDHPKLNEQMEELRAAVGLERRAGA